MRKLSALLASLLLVLGGVGPAMAAYIEADATGQNAVVQPGSKTIVRETRNRSLANAETEGRYQEAVLGGNVYSVASAAAGNTLVAANLSPLNSSTGQPIAGVYNPLNSGKNLVVLEACVGISSNTALGGSPGSFYYNVNAGQNITQAGTVPINNLTGLQRGSVAIGLVNQALTGGTGTVLALKPVANAPVAYLPVASLGTNVTTPQGCELVDGKIIVPPGGMLGLANGISNTSAVVEGSLTWEEIPL